MVWKVVPLYILPVGRNMMADGYDLIEQRVALLPRAIASFRVIRALENEQDDRAKVNGLFGSLNDWKG
jgi:hypothetical protein